MSAAEIIKLVWPFVILQIAFQAYALFDLFKTRGAKTRNLNTIAWTVIIVLGEVFGAAAYFILGRNEE